MLSNKRMLQFQAPKSGEPLCSGRECTLQQGERIDMAHFHTVVTVTLGHPRALIFGASGEIAIGCSVTINGKEYDRQQFVITRDDIGSTLFCAGFPCITVTGLDEENSTLMVTFSEIVEPCEPGTCPWGGD
jgi:hypothetical protein